ncbi:hypothetical protein DERF_006766 [Dermatophagoides farinae]|uniref:Dual oxidase maturation factor 1-like n=1 Tax=Dermatophagoides farinae TaxID=6954 RepID=A0A922I0V5_DERFA|nr:hypothetical protein DERF_006766 [Dermatophagoides farinae]
MSSSSPDLVNIGASWFDAFQDNGGPVLYSSMNRTAAIEDIRNILIYISFTTFFVAFLIIFPGIRKERVSTFICVTTSLFIGAVILISNCGSNWHVAKGSIAGPYRAFSKEKIYANVGVYIGLDSVNITLKALPIHQQHEEINYNERFYWIGANQMKHEFQRALAKGLPFPILTISEYLSQDGEGFNWGRHYRLAGYYTSISLWLAFASWILMNILLCAVPRYGAYTMQLTGLLMLLSNLLYVMMIPSKPLRIPFEGSTLIFTYGWCFWLVFAAGLTACFIGATVSIVDILFPNKFSTILEVDYDTPYRYFVGNDIHIIGSLPPPLNAYYYHHQHQSSLSTASHQSSSHHLYQKKKSSTNMIRHYSASKTASLTTNTSSCCAGSTTRLTAHHQSIIKTKSDASTCTRDDVDDLIMMMANETQENHDETITATQCMTDSDSSSKQTFITKVEIESNANDDNNNNTVIVSNYSKDSVQRTNQLNQNDKIFNNNNSNNDHNDDGDKQFAFENRAYQIDDDDDFKNDNNNCLLMDENQTTVQQKQMKEKPSKELLMISTTPSPLMKSTSSSSPSSSASSISTDIDDDDDDDVDNDDENESDVSTTMIDGKRAISLSNFGKYTEQREKREGLFNRSSMIGPTFGHPLASAGFRAVKSGFITRTQQQRKLETNDSKSMKKTMDNNRIKSSSITSPSSSVQEKDTTTTNLIYNNNNNKNTTSGGSSNGYHSTSSLSSSSTNAVRVDLSSSAAMW